jgi:Spy/CpxP family protein refolding chaperone
MKKLLILSLAACMFTLTTIAQIERPTEVKQTTERHKGNHEKGKMMKELNFSKEQQAQLKTIQKEMKAKREALKAQDNITVKEMKERKPALKAEQQNKMAAILTPEQQAKMEEIKKNKKAGKAGKTKKAPKMQDRENQPTAQ